MEKIDVKIEGISHLLQHRYVFKNEKEEEAKKRTGKPDYSEEWKKSLYWDDKLGVYQPAQHIESAMIKAAVSFQIPGKGKKTYKDLFKSAIFVKPDFLSHGLNGSIDKLLKNKRFAIDRRLVRVNNSGVERLRPRLDEWSLEFQIEVHDEQIHKDTVRQILEHAGRYVGIGDFRPKFGRFGIVKFG